MSDCYENRPLRQPLIRHSRHPFANPAPHFHPLMRPSRGHGDSRDQKHAPYPDTGLESRRGGPAGPPRATLSRYRQFRHNLRSLFDHNLANAQDKLRSNLNSYGSGHQSTPPQCGRGACGRVLRWVCHWYESMSRTPIRDSLPTRHSGESRESRGGEGGNVARGLVPPLRARR